MVLEGLNDVDVDAIASDCSALAGGELMSD